MQPTARLRDTDDALAHICARSASPVNITLIALPEAAASKPASSCGADQPKRCVISGSTSTRLEDMSEMQSGYVSVGQQRG